MTLDAFIADHPTPLNANEMRLKDIQKPFQPWSPYPFITRDIAVWLDNSVEKSKLEKILSDFANEYCVRSPYLIDEFSKDNRLSVAFRLIFQAQNRTLTDEEARAWMDILFERLKSEKTFVIR
jgi:phenylalanyl-tRNA synthetase beta subunit